MAELTISSDEIRSAIENYVSSYSPEVNREEVGTVTVTGDGIAYVEGLPSAMANELLEFPGGVLGVALNLDVRELGVAILGNYESIDADFLFHEADTRSIHVDMQYALWIMDAVDHADALLKELGVESRLRKP